jgi:hypothetical protein
MKSLSSLLLITLFLHAFTWEGKSEKRLLIPSLERALLLRAPEKGLIKGKELSRLPLSGLQKSMALRHLERFAERVPLDDSRVFWIDRFHRDLYRAILAKRPGTEADTFRPVETSWRIRTGHQSGVLMRPDGLPLPNNESSPYLEAGLQLLMKARELPRYGSLALELYGHRRDMERKQLSAYDSQSMGVALSFRKAVRELRLDLEQSFFGNSATRPGAVKAKVSWEDQNEVISAFLNGKLIKKLQLQHQTFTDQVKYDQSGNKKDATKVDFELKLELLPFQFFGGRTLVTVGSTISRQSSSAPVLDRLGLKPCLQLKWKEPSGSYEFESRVSHLLYSSQNDSLGVRDDQLLTWEAKLQRNMSEQWAIHGGWEFQDHTSKQTIYDQRNEVLFIGMDGRW